MDSIYRTRNGLFKIYEPDYIISGWIKKGAMYDHNLLNNYLQPIISKSKYIVDAGANIGCHSISYANFNPSAKIYSFEPQTDIFSILETNKRLNDSSNVTCFRKALGHVNKLINMNPPLKTPDGINYAGTGVGQGGEPIEMITLDSLDLPGLDFIKMDVQGSEGLVIMGGRNTIDKYSPIILFEHDDTFVIPEHVGLTEVPTPFFELVKLGYNTFKYLGENNYITYRDSDPNFEDAFKKTLFSDTST
jgi:FkbM family methyltransferase